MSVQMCVLQEVNIAISNSLMTNQIAEFGTAIH